MTGTTTTRRKILARVKMTWPEIKALLQDKFTLAQVANFTDCSRETLLSRGAMIPQQIIDNPEIWVSQMEYNIEQQAKYYSGPKPGY
jgi:hypothetical protein